MTIYKAIYLIKYQADDYNVLRAYRMCKYIECGHVSRAR